MCEFLRSRSQWLRVEKIERGEGRWDVALLIDGTYLIEDPKFEKKLLEDYRRQISRALKKR